VSQTYKGRDKHVLNINLTRWETVGAYICNATV